MSDSSTITWATAIVALAAGAIGSVLTGLLAFGARVLRIGREIEANDRALQILDRHLETWASDATINLVRELTDVRNDLSARNLLYSGAYGAAFNRAKERQLHAYRDQERTAQSQAAEIRAREGSLHALVRAWRFSDRDIELQTPERVIPLLERWAEPAIQHLSPSDVPQPLDSDPRTRTIESSLAYLDAHPKALV